MLGRSRVRTPTANELYPSRAVRNCPHPSHPHGDTRARSGPLGVSQGVDRGRTPRVQHEPDRVLVLTDVVDNYWALRTWGNAAASAGNFECEWEKRRLPCAHLTDSLGYADGPAQGIASGWKAINSESDAPGDSRASEHAMGRRLKNRL